jgi:hypothetical protein
MERNTQRKLGISRSRSPRTRERLFVKVESGSSCSFLFNRVFCQSDSSCVAVAVQFKARLSPPDANLSWTLTLLSAVSWDLQRIRRAGADQRPD